MSNPMIAPFQIMGPTNGPYPGTVCFPQVPLPKNATVKAGDKATIQIVEIAVHGAALYSVCVNATKKTDSMDSNVQLTYKYAVC
jgi:hypothetical protein